MSFREDYREQKEESGLTWDEFVEREIYHKDEIDHLEQQVGQLESQVVTLTKVITRLQRELHEHNVLEEREDR
jgi:phage shock protein A